MTIQKGAAHISVRCPKILSFFIDLCLTVAVVLYPAAYPVAVYVCQKLWLAV